MEDADDGEQPGIIGGLKCPKYLPFFNNLLKKEKKRAGDAFPSSLFFFSRLNDTEVGGGKAWLL